MMAVSACAVLDWSRAVAGISGGRRCRRSSQNVEWGWS